MGVSVFSQVWKAYDVWRLRDDLGDASRPVLPDGSRKSDADMLAVFRADADRGNYALVNDRG
jgi:hypothetical protein